MYHCVERIYQKEGRPLRCCTQGLPPRCLRRWWAPSPWERVPWLSKWPLDQQPEHPGDCEKCTSSGPAHSCRVRGAGTHPCGEALLSCAPRPACHEHHTWCLETSQQRQSPPGDPSPQVVPPTGLRKDVQTGEHLRIARGGASHMSSPGRCLQTSWDVDDTALSRLRP